MSRFEHDEQSGLYLPRTRRVEALAPRLCSAGVLAHRGLLLGGGAPADADALRIYNSLDAWWTCDDNAANTTVLDAHSTHHMAVIGGSNTSGVSYTSPIKKNRSLGNTGDSFDIRLPRSDSIADKGDVDFSFGGWWYTQGGTFFGGGYSYQILGRGALGVAGKYSYIICHNRDASTPRFTLFLSPDGTSNTSLQSANIDPRGTWTFLVGVHDSVNNQMRLYINNVEYTASYSSGVYSGQNANLALGPGVYGDSTIADAARHNQGWSDESFLSNRAMTASDVAYLWASGAGRSYAELKTAAGF